MNTKLDDYNMWNVLFHYKRKQNMVSQCVDASHTPKEAM